MVPFLTTREFAEKLGVCPETIRRWVRAKKIAPAGQTPTGHYRFREEQVGQAINNPASNRAEDLSAHVHAANAKIRRLRQKI